MEKLRLSKAVVVEGKYDKIKLSSIIDGVIIVTNGFDIYNNKELCALIRAYAEKTGLIVMTDSDRAGRQIRAHIKRIVPKELHGNIVNLHIPQIFGKEKRKASPSKEGTLGVEGIDADILRELIGQVCSAETELAGKEPITKNDMYLFGLSGGADSRSKRERLAARLGLPKGLSSVALLDILNSFYGREDIERLCAEL